MDKTKYHVITNLIFQHIPAVAALDLDITNIDVFCEKGVYDAEQTRLICEAGKVCHHRLSKIGKLLGIMQFAIMVCGGSKSQTL